LHQPDRRNKAKEMGYATDEVVPARGALTLRPGMTADRSRIEIPHSKVLIV
jgi:hypothetical protein